MYRRTIQGLAVGLAVAAGALLAQAPAAFEVATIREAPPIQDLIRQIQSGQAKLGMTVDGSRVDMGFASLADLVRMAYDVKPYQVQGPDWLKQQRFEIQAKIPDGATKDQVPQMLQSLLADRFKMTTHKEQRELPIYALVVGKNGPKLTPAAAEPDKPIADADKALSVGTEKGQVSIARSGQGVEVQGAGVGTMRVSQGPNGIHLTMSRITMAALADTLTQFVGDKPVIDMTGLKGEYQIAMDLPLEDLMILAQRQMSQLGIQMPGQPLPGVAPGQAPAPSGGAIFDAVDKLGLKLDSRKGPLDMIVVDHMEKTPTEN